MLNQKYIHVTCTAVIKAFVSIGVFITVIVFFYLFSSSKSVTFRSLLDPFLPRIANLIPLENYYLTKSSYLHRKDKIQDFLLKDNGSYSAVLIGDSHIQRFDQKNLLSFMNTLNLGVSGDTTNGLLRYVCHLDTDVTADKAFILLGYNDLKYRSVIEIGKSYKKIINCILEGKVLEINEIIILSLLPVGKERVFINKRIQEVNSLLKKLSSYNKVHFINSYLLFVDMNGEQKKQLFTKDKVHLNAEGYRVLGDLIIGY